MSSPNNIENEETAPENEDLTSDIPLDSPIMAAQSPRVQKAYRSILLQIIRGDIPGGTKLKTTELSKELDISRTPVREALTLLAAGGFVTLEANKWALVREGAENWVHEINEVRECLEPRAAELAAKRIPNEEIVRLRKMAGEIDFDGENWLDQLIDFDCEIHFTIARECGNRVLDDAIRKCWEFKRVSYMVFVEDPENLKRSHEEHCDILDALENRDSATAFAAMLWHIRSAATKMTAGMKAASKKNQ